MMTIESHHHVASLQNLFSRHPVQGFQKTRQDSQDSVPRTYVFNRTVFVKLSLLRCTAVLVLVEQYPIIWYLLRIVLYACTTAFLPLGITVAWWGRRDV